MFQPVTVYRSPYAIETVQLRVATQTGLGRTENYRNALRLMRRLEAIGTRKLIILAMCEAGRSIPTLQVNALNHYLRTGFGLRYFRRSNREWQDATAWYTLRELVGFPPIDAR